MVDLDLKVPLPENQTPYETAFAKLADRLFDIDNPTRKFFSAFDCPIELLPLLAWFLSVDVWDNAWPEETKRRVIDAAPEVHRKKGTVAAVEKALEALGVEFELIEWWQQEPPSRRGTFHISLKFQRASDLLSTHLQGQVSRVVNASKPKSRTYISEAILISDPDRFIGASCFSGGTVIGGITIEDPTTEPTNIQPIVTAYSGGTIIGGLQ